MQNYSHLLFTSEFTVLYIHTTSLQEEQAVTHKVTPPLPLPPTHQITCGGTHSTYVTTPWTGKNQPQWIPLEDSIKKWGPNHN